MYKSVLSIPSEEMLAKVDSLRKSNKEVDRERRMVNHHYPLCIYFIVKFSQNQCAKIYYPYVKICPGVWRVTCLILYKELYTSLCDGVLGWESVAFIAS